MDILPVSATPVAIISRQHAEGVSNHVQTAPVVSVPGSSSASASSAAAANAPPSSNQVEQAVRRVNDTFAQKGLNLYASFERDKTTGITVIQFKDEDTGDVIRQIPSKEILAFAQSLELPQGWRGQWVRNMS